MYGHGRHTVFIDANVLYSLTLRDWVLLAALSPVDEVYRVRWSEDVLTEALYHLRRTHPQWPSNRIEGLRERLEVHFGECRVTGFAMDPGYDGPDENDRHVHSAAVACGADILLTSDLNLLEWSSNKEEDLPYEAQDPDTFLCLVDDLAPRIIDDVVREQSRYWTRRRGEALLVEHLRDAGAPGFADRVRSHVRRIALRG